MEAQEKGRPPWVSGKLEFETLVPIQENCSSIHNTSHTKFAHFCLTWLQIRGFPNPLLKVNHLLTKLKETMLDVKVKTNFCAWGHHYISQSSNWGSIPPECRKTFQELADPEFLKGTNFQKLNFFSLLFLAWY
jgi:hypothetical protein